MVEVIQQQLQRLEQPVVCNASAPQLLALLSIFHSLLTITKLLLFSSASLTSSSPFVRFACLSPSVLSPSFFRVHWVLTFFVRLVEDCIQNFELMAIWFWEEEV